MSALHEGRKASNARFANLASHLFTLSRVFLRSDALYARAQDLPSTKEKGARLDGLAACLKLPWTNLSGISSIVHVYNDLSLAVIDHFFAYHKTAPRRWGVNGASFAPTQVACPNLVNLHLRDLTILCGKGSSLCTGVPAPKPFDYSSKQEPARSKAI
jgi:hypothetical protein